MAQQPRQLDYAPAEPVLRARRRRRLVVAIVVAVIAAVAYWGVPPLYQETRQAWQWRQALRHIQDEETLMLSARMNSSSTPISLLAFIHRRDNSHGARLVAIQVEVILVDGELWYAVEPRVSRDRHEMLTGQQRWKMPFQKGTTFDGSIRIFAGQPDPEDRSRFSIRYEIDGNEGFFDGQLFDDDSVMLHLRGGTPANPGEDILVTY